MQSGLIQNTLVNPVYGRLDFHAGNSHVAERRELTGAVVHEIVPNAAALAKPRRTYLTVRYVTNDGTEPAQRELVHRLIDWNRIRSRQERYPAIGRAFPLELMKKGCESPPSSESIGEEHRPSQVAGDVDVRLIT